MRNTHQRLALVAALAGLSACAPAVRGPTPAPAGLPPIPEVEGPLEIRVVHPTPGTTLPRVDSTFVYGSVGTGRASLSINGVSVPVAPNGAFLAYLPVPRDGTWQLTARTGRRAASATARYRVPEPQPAPAPVPAPGAAPAVEEFAPARSGIVTGGADTLATGSEVAIGRAAPGGAYRWFLPRGARVQVSGRRGELFRVRLDSATVAWFPAGDITLDAAAPGGAAPAPGGAAVAVQPADGWVDLRFAADGAPFRVEAAEDRIELTLYGRQAPPGPSPTGADPLIAGLHWQGGAPDAARATVRLARPAWGYKAFYEPDGSLALRIRRPPRVDPEAPLRGRRIAIDPGHPPGGATGPTGLTEAEANLAISLRLAEQLRARGAEVLLTRREDVPLSLSDRVEMVVDWDAELLISVHNNAFAEGVNPFRNYGTSVYHFHPFSAGLARALDREIAATTRIPDLGAKWGNLALVRPTWLPSSLTESLFMLIPEQEAALRDPAFLDRLAAAHVRGIEEFLRHQSPVVSLPSRSDSPARGNTETDDR